MPWVNKSGWIPLPQQDSEPQDGDDAADEGAPGGALAQQPDAEQHRHQRGQPHHQPDLGGPQGLGRVVAEGLVQHHAEQGQHGQPGKTGPQLVTHAPGPPCEEGGQHQGRHHPARPGQGGRREHPHRQLADDAVAGPDGHAGEGEQESKGHRYVQRKGADISREYREANRISKHPDAGRGNLIRKSI